MKADSLKFWRPQKVEMFSSGENTIPSKRTIAKSLTFEVIWQAIFFVQNSKFFVCIMLIGWWPTSLGSYRPFNSSRLVAYLNPQRRMWKWQLIYTIQIVLFVMNSFVDTCVVGLILPSIPKLWMVYKNYTWSVFN